MNARAARAPAETSGATPPSRRGACPALAAPMRTGDGLLIRLSPASGVLSPRMLIGLCESAACHGNGVIEITARGSLQFRGFSEGSAAHFAADVDALGLEVRTGVPVETSPLAGMDNVEIADPRAVADAVRSRIAREGLAERLGPKVSVVVDGGGSISMDMVAADVRLMAVRVDGGIAWTVSLGGNATSAKPIGISDHTAAIDAALSELLQIADLGIEGRGRDLLSSRPTIGHTILAPGLASPFPSASRIRSTPLPPPQGEDGRRVLHPAEAPFLQAETSLHNGTSPTSSSKVYDAVRRPSSPSGGASISVPKASGAPVALSKIEKAGSLPKAAGTRRGGEPEGRDGEGEGVAGRVATADVERETNSMPEGGSETDSFTPIPLKSNETALPVALPFGHAEATTLIALARQAEALGVSDIRPSPDRRLLLICPDEIAALALQITAASLGIITTSRDPRSAIAACPGAPACASGHIAARQIAADFATAVGDAFDPDISIHISGCEKGCARQASADITIVGGENGAGLVVRGTARSVPLAYGSSAGLPGAIAAVAAVLRIQQSDETATRMPPKRNGAAVTEPLSPAEIAEFAAAFRV